MVVEQYRQIIQQLILARAQRRSALLPRGEQAGEGSSADAGVPATATLTLSPQEEIEKQAILDTERDHYLLLIPSGRIK